MHLGDTPAFSPFTCRQMPLGRRPAVGGNRVAKHTTATLPAPCHLSNAPCDPALMFVLRVHSSSRRTTRTGRCPTEWDARHERRAFGGWGREGEGALNFIDVNPSTILLALCSVFLAPLACPVSPPLQPRRSQELEVRLGNDHISFATSKIGSLLDVQSSKDPDGLRVFYYLVQARGPPRAAWGGHLPAIHSEGAAA